MATKPVLARLDLSIGSGARFFRPAILAEYWALTKPEVNFLILITTFAGFCLARGPGWRDFPFWLSINALLGTLLISQGRKTEQVRRGQIRRINDAVAKHQKSRKNVARQRGKKEIQDH